MCIADAMRTGVIACSVALALAACRPDGPSPGEVERTAPRPTYAETAFPGESWPITPAADAGWDPERLEDLARFAEGNRTSSLCIVYQGRLLLDRSWRPKLSDLSPMDRQAVEWTLLERLPDGRWLQDVASIEKSLVALLLAVAERRGELAYDDRVFDHLPRDSADLPFDLSNRVTISHLTNMTSGLHQGGAAPGEVWSYDPMAPQVLLLVLEAAGTRSLEQRLREDLAEPLGARSLRWTRHPERPAYRGLGCTARDLARLGLLVQTRGRWGDRELLARAEMEELLRPSQDLNPNYGRLWFLNRPGALLPGGARLEDAPLPFAPDDLVVALGIADSALMVSESEQLVVVRMGAPIPGSRSGRGAGLEFLDELWRRLLAARPGA